MQSDKVKIRGKKETLYQKRLFLREEDLNTALGRAASAMECNIGALINPKRLSGLDKDKRDILSLQSPRR